MAGGEPLRHDPFVAFRFVVEIEGLSSKLKGGFSKCTGLDLETEVLDYQEGGLNQRVHRFPTRIVQKNLVLERGIVDRELWYWYMGSVPGRPITTRSGSVLLLDGSETPQLSWRFEQGFPVRIGGPQLAADQNQIAIETFELAHQGVRLHNPPKQGKR